jgi:hypothetical protein
MATRKHREELMKKRAVAKSDRGKDGPVDAERERMGGSFQHAAMRRVQSRSRSYSRRARSPTCGTLQTRETTTVAVHEPNLLRLVAGANAIHVETGANARHTLKATAGGRGLEVPAARRMLLEAGFAWLRRGDSTRCRWGGAAQLAGRSNGGQVELERAQTPSPGLWLDEERKALPDEPFRVIGVVGPQANREGIG